MANYTVAVSLVVALRNATANRINPTFVEILGFTVHFNSRSGQAGKGEKVGGEGDVLSFALAVTQIDARKLLREDVFQCVTHSL